MTLEQQVASLVTATTSLTSVVNAELDSVRLENNNFKTSTTASLNTIVGEKVRSGSFTIYVNPIGSSSPTDPINNISAPFNTIANAVGFLNSYYWTGEANISLSSGIHLVNSSIGVWHTCSISITGASVPSLSGVSAIVSQTTLANKDSSSLVEGSNLNLFDYLSSAFQSHIVVTTNNVFAFSLYDATFSITNCFLYYQQKTNTGDPSQSNIGIHAGSGSSSPVLKLENCAFMYFRYGVVNRSYSSLSLVGINVFSGNIHGLVNWDMSSAMSVNTSRVFCSGNVSGGISSTSGITCHFSDVSSIANGQSGFSSYVNANYNIINGTSKNNGAYGYYVRDSGLIVASGISDTSTTGNALGKKYEQNSLQGFIVGISAT